MDEKQESQSIALQGKNSGWENIKAHQFKPGQSGNPSGRAKGTVSLKTWAQKYIQELTDEEKLEFISGLDKIDIWKMSEGNPNNALDVKANITMANVLRNQQRTRSVRNIIEQTIPAGLPIQDTKQEQGISDVPKEQSTDTLPSPQVVEKYNPEESATGVYNGGSY